MVGSANDPPYMAENLGNRRNRAVWENERSTPHGGEDQANQEGGSGRWMDETSVRAGGFPGRRAARGQKRRNVQGKFGAETFLPALQGRKFRAGYVPGRTTLHAAGRHVLTKRGPECRIRTEETFPGGEQEDLRMKGSEKHTPGGLPPTQELTCTVCGGKFLFRGIERQRFARWGWQPPKRCPLCRQA